MLDERVRAGIAIIAAAALISGCGSSDKVVGGSAKVTMPTPPDYLDPQLASTPEGAQADWIAYTPLLTYRHKSGADGTELIPGLAARLPRISPDGRRYRLALRKGLVYSNGRPVTAGDFEYTIERAIRLGWPGKHFLTDNILGAKAFDRGQAKDISGIETDDATGTITIDLVRPWGAFENVLGLPATGLVPSGTPMRDLSADPPPGVGAYRITDVRPGRSWTMVRNHRFEALEIPDIPSGSLERIAVKIVHSPAAAASQVISGRADGYDPGAPVPPGVQARARALGSKRFDMLGVPSTLYFFLNTVQPPFNSELARRAVVTALDRPYMAKLSKGALEPGCYLIPDGIAGHPTASCPYGDADEPGDLKAARQLVQASGTAGTPVVVWVEDSSPERAYARYYTKLLNRLGFDARTKTVATAQDFGRMVGARVEPQTGFASWFNDFPNPINFYSVLDSQFIGPPGSPNMGHVNDLFIQQQLEKLSLVQGQDLGSVAGEWRDLDEYAARKAYLAVLGTQQVPRLISARIDPSSAVIHPLFLSDWSSWSLR
ncbi:MAG TPA: ABC transporter substrate-binding protein [Solirubrobacterales bacterium]|nr:ABC transporter substrate-binding protein [Solirubrobacterales bacterium]